MTIEIVRDGQPITVANARVAQFSVVRPFPVSPVNRILADALFRINGLLLLIGSLGIAYLRLHESGSPIKLFLHSLTFVAFGLFFARLLCSSPAFCPSLS